MTLAVSLCMHFQILSNSEDKRPDKTISDISVNLFKRRYEFHGFRHLDRVMWSTNARMSMDYACFINMILVLANLFSNPFCRCAVHCKRRHYPQRCLSGYAVLYLSEPSMLFIRVYVPNYTGEIQYVIVQYQTCSLYSHCLTYGKCQLTLEASSR